METLEVNNETKRKCIFCFKNSNFNSESQTRISIIVQDIYNSCMKYINSDYLTEDDFRNWNRPDPLPFCQKCLICCSKLNRMNQKLQQIQKQIEQLVTSFTKEFLKSRENPNICSEDDGKEEFLKSKEHPNICSKDDGQEEFSKSRENPNICAEDDGQEEFSKSRENPNICAEDGGQEEFSKSRENPNICAEDDGQEEFPASNYLQTELQLQDEITEKESLPIKQEPNERTDFFEENESSQLSPFGTCTSNQDSNDDTYFSFHEMKPVIKPEKKHNGKRKKKKRSRSKKSSPKRLNAGESVNQRRMQLDTDGNPIPKGDLLPRRKAAMKAEETFTSLKEDPDTLGDKDEVSDSETSASEDEFNPSAEDAGFLNYTESGKLRKRASARRKGRKGADKDKPFECVQCNKFYTTKSHLQDHILTHDKNNRFKCTICEDVSFAYIRGLRQHMFKHENNLLVQKTFKCKKCDTTFKTNEEFQDHTKETHKNMLYECSVCGVSFTFLQSLEQHSVEIHKIHLTDEGMQRDIDNNQTPKDHVKPVRKAAKKAEDNFISRTDDSDKLSDKDHVEADIPDSEKSVSEDECNSSVKSGKRRKGAGNLRKRRKGPDKYRPFECVQCNKFYTSKSHLQDHILTHSKDNRFKCTICEDVSFAYIRGLRQHMFKHKHNLLVEKTFKCKKCDTTFKSTKELKDHNREIHKNMIYECSVCGVSYTFLKSLQQHSLEIHNLHLTYEGEHLSVTNEEPEIDILSFCNICNKQYKNKETLKSHKRKTHGPIQKRYCKQCNKEFKTDSGLKEHMDRHNRDPSDVVETNKFKCTICEKVLSSRGNLNVHILGHRNVKPFECALKCGKWFSTKSHAKHHLLFHKGERAFLCEECGKSFFTRGKLKDHTRIHTGLLHFCEFCGKGFQNTTHLKQHHRSHKKDIDTALQIELPPLQVPSTLDSQSQEGIFMNLLPPPHNVASSSSLLLQ